MKIASDVAIPPNVPKELYRTKICNYFSKGEDCKYGHKCFFAHGKHELRNVSSTGKTYHKSTDNEEEDDDYNDYSQETTKLESDLTQAREEVKKLTTLK